jgi:hypothetical protein
MTFLKFEILIFNQIPDLASLASISRDNFKTATKLKAESIMWQNNNNIQIWRLFFFSKIGIL